MYTPFVESLKEAPVSDRNSTTTEPTTDEEETSPTSSQSHKLSVSSAVSSTSTVPDHSSPEPFIGIADGEDNAIEVTSLTGTLFEISSSKSSSFDSNPSAGSSIPKCKRFFPHHKFRLGRV